MATPDVVLDALEAATGPEDPPAWFEVFSDEVSRTVALLRHDDPGQLFGWVSATDCEAIGVVAGGWGRPAGLDLGGPAPCQPDGPAAPQRVRVIVVVGRDGTVGSRTTLGDGSVLKGGCRGGRLFDAVHRSLGLPTDPAPVSSAPLIGDLWLAGVVSAGEGLGRRLGWAEVTARHPAVQVLIERGHPLRAAEVDAVIRVAPRAWTWERLQADTVAGGGLSELVAPSIAAWMDEGMFARWTLRQHGDARELWGRASSMLDDEAVIRLAQALDDAEVADIDHSPATANAVDAGARGGPSAR